VIVDDEVPFSRNVAQASGVLSVPNALLKIDGVGAIDPVAGAREFHRRSAIEQQMNLDILVSIPQTLGCLERFDRVANRVVVHPIQQDRFR
jgi:hypothetical protein